MAARRDGNAVISGHADGSLHRFQFDSSIGSAGSAKFAQHSCAPTAVAWGNDAVLATGSDCQVNLPASCCCCLACAHSMLVQTAYLERLHVMIWSCLPGTHKCSCLTTPMHFQSREAICRGMLGHQWVPMLQVTLYDTQGGIIQQLDFSSAPDMHDFTCAAFNPSGDIAVLGGYNSLNSCSFNAQADTWELNTTKQVSSASCIGGLVLHLTHMSLPAFLKVKKYQCL